jgi:hypothetical protein
MKIQVEVEIFDDAEYCRGEFNRDGKCEQLKELKYFSVCRIFKNEAGRKFVLVYDQEKGIPEKCPQCKAVYHKPELDK